MDLKTVLLARLYHGASRNRELWIFRSESLKPPSWGLFAWRTARGQPRGAEAPQAVPHHHVPGPGRAVGTVAVGLGHEGEGNMELPQGQVKEKRAPGADCHRPGCSEPWLRAEHHKLSPWTPSGHGEHEGSRGSAGCSLGAGSSPS